MIQRWTIDALDLHDHKLVYWVAGLISSASILIERKHRRKELAMYAFPRAADSLYQIMYSRKLVGKVKNGTLLLFCLSMSAIMYCHENYRNDVSPLVASLLRRFVDYNPSIQRIDSVSSEIGRRPLSRVPENMRMSTTQFL